MRLFAELQVILHDCSMFLNQWSKEFAGRIIVSYNFEGISTGTRYFILSTADRRNLVEETENHVVV